MIKIYNASLEQLDEIMKIYEKAKEFMRLNGNPNQWNNKYPSRKLLINDINSKNLYIGIDEKNVIHCVFCFIIGEEPTYKEIEQGKWLNENVYGTIHRIASDGKIKGIFNLCLDFCKNKISNIKIDTHKDNKVMQHLIEKNGFIKCGIIHLDDNSERIAYQYTG